MKQLYIGLILFAFADNNNAPENTQQTVTEQEIEEPQPPSATELIEQKLAGINSNIGNLSLVADDDIAVTKDINPENFAYETLDLYQLGSAGLKRYYAGESIRVAVVSYDAINEDIKSMYYFEDGDLIYAERLNTKYSEQKSSPNFDETQHKKKVAKNSTLKTTN